MYQGNWKCSTCGGAITELPFQPRSEAGLTCRVCYAKKKDGQSVAPTPAPEPDMQVAGEMTDDFPLDAGLASEPAPGDPFAGIDAAPAEKPKFTGDWKCAECDGAITSLPFAPRDTSNLKCIDCFKRSKA